MSDDFKRPHGTTANPDWANATCPTDFVPTTDDKHGRGKRMVQMVGAFKLTQGQYAGRRLGDGVLLPWQTDLVRYIFGETDSKGNRKIRRVGLIIGKGPLALDTPIPTPSGWTTMGDLNVGDTVFAKDGTPTSVIEVSEVFTGNDCFRITFSDGTAIVADAGHRWPDEARAGGSCRR